MILAIFLAVCGTGALLGLTFQQSGRAGQFVNLVALACAAAAAVALGSGGQAFTIGDTQLSTTSYATAFLMVAATSCLLLCVVGVASHPEEAIGRLAPAALAAIGGFGVAFTSVDPRVSLIAGTAAAATGTLTLVHRPAAGDTAPATRGSGKGSISGGGAVAGMGHSTASGGLPAAGAAAQVAHATHPDARVTELRILALIGGALLLAAVVAMRPAWAGPQDRAFGAAFLALALAVAVRGGVIPFHIPASHLSTNATPSAMALLLVLIPAGLGALALTWSPIAFHARAGWLDVGIGGIQAVAIATIVLGALAALVHDRLEEIVAYSIVADAGFVLAALAARSEDAAEPARMWLLVFVAGKTALVAWAAAMNRAFANSELPSLRGWLRRTPLLGLCLVAIAVATIGWPGSGVANARDDIVQLGLPRQLWFVESVGIVLSAAYYLRVLFMGVLRPTPTVRESWSERPRLGFSLRRPKPAVAEQGAAETRAVAVAAIAVVAVTDAAETPASSAPPGTDANEAVEPAPPTETVATETATANETTENPTPAEPPPTPKRKRRSKAAAADASMPTVTAEVPSTDAPALPASDAAAEPANQAATPAGGTTTSGSDAPTPAPRKLVVGRRRSGPSIGHRLGVMWRLNRTLEVSGVMAMAAVFSLAIAAGSLGTGNAAREGLPLGTAAHATATLRPTPSLPPTQGPLATGTPIPSAPPSGSQPIPTLPGSPRTSAPTPIIK